MKACMFCIFGLLKAIGEWLIGLFYSKTDKRIKRSFITFVSTCVIWLVFIEIMYLVHYEVTSGIEKLSSLSAIVATVFGTMCTAYGVITAAYNNGKTREKIEQMGRTEYYRPMRSPSSTDTECRDNDGVEKDEYVRGISKNNSEVEK